MLAQAAAIAADEDRQRRLGHVFWIAVGWMVLIVLAAILAPWLPIKDPDKNYIDRSLGRPPYSPSSRVLVRHRQGRPRHVLAHDLGRPCVAHGRFRGDRLRHADRRHAAGCSPATSAAGATVSCRSCSLVLLSFPAPGAGDPDHDAASTAVCSRSRCHARHPGDRSGRPSCAGDDDPVRRSRVRRRRPHARRHATKRIIVRELLPNVVIPMGALALLGMAVAIVAEGALAFLGLSVENGIVVGQADPVRVRDRATLEDAPWVAFAPITVLFLTVAVAQLLRRQGPRPLRRQGDGALMTRAGCTQRGPHRVRGSLLEVNDLQDPLPHRARAGARRRRRHLLARARQGTRRRRRVGLRQDRAQPLDHGAAAVERRARPARSGSPGRRCSGSIAEQMRHLWGREMSMVFQNPMVLAQPGDEDRQADRGAAPRSTSA